MRVTKDTLGHVFSYHKFSPEQVSRSEQIREQAKTLADLILANVVDSKEREIALDRIREVVMWANAGIAVNEVNPPKD